MKIVVIALFTATMFVACNCGASRSTATDVADSVSVEVGSEASVSTAATCAAAVNVLDSLTISPELGELLTRTYQGVLPAASCPGIDYTLVIYSQKNSGDGVYMLSQRYIEAENGQDLTFTTYGRRYTLRGDAKNVDAVVYQLVPFDSKEYVNLLLLGDGSLELLNTKFERAESKLNYTLKLQRE